MAATIAREKNNNLALEWAATDIINLRTHYRGKGRAIPNGMIDAVISEANNKYGLKDAASQIKRPTVLSRVSRNNGPPKLYLGCTLEVLEIGKYFELKEKSIGPPKLYLGGHLSLVELDNGVKAWALSSSKYVRDAVQIVEDFIAKDENKRWKLRNKAEIPLCTSYRPELDVTPELRCDWFHVS
jgi:hypothetical protein